MTLSSSIQRLTLFWYYSRLELFQYMLGISAPFSLTVNYSQIEDKYHVTFDVIILLCYSLKAAIWELFMALFMCTNPHTAFFKLLYFVNYQQFPLHQLVSRNKLRAPYRASVYAKRSSIWTACKCSLLIPTKPSFAFYCFSPHERPTVLRQEWAPEVLINLRIKQRLPWRSQSTNAGSITFNFRKK